MFMKIFKNCILSGPPCISLDLFRKCDDQDSLPEITSIDKKIKENYNWKWKFHFIEINVQDIGTYASSEEAPRVKVVLRFILTINGGRFAMITGARPTHKSSVDNLVTVLRHRLLVALISAKDPCGSYSMMYLVLVARHLWPRVLILEWDRITVDIQKTPAFGVVQVRWMWIKN